jgi:16S rRNA (cytidine1402-2'-O)-methyltransferase
LKGTLYLIPVTIGESDLHKTIPAGVSEVVKRLRVFIVEEIRTARRYLRKTDPAFPLDDVVFHILNEHTGKAEHAAFLTELMEGNDTGLMSEAGLPGIADPGANIVALAHRKGIKVSPLAGPSSILLGLIASGLNGQRFAFNGYLPVKQNERIKAIREMEVRSSEGEAQVFMETPYRNMKLLTDLINVCRGNTMLCVAAGITTAEEFISTRSIGEWKKDLPVIDRIPAVFVLQG